MAPRPRVSDDTPRIALGLFAALAAASVGIFAFSWMSTASLEALLRLPADLWAGIERESAAGELETAAEVTAGVLGIAMTVVAIVVELAATRYSHRITFLFIRNRVNAVVLGLFVVTTLQCLWMASAVLPGGSSGPVPSAGFAITLALVTLSLLVLLPYFAWVLSFISPLNVVGNLQRLALAAVGRARSGGVVRAHHALVEAVDELQDIARAAVGQGDRSIAMACVDAFHDLVGEYQDLRGELPAEWHDARESLAGEPDFVSLAPSAMDEALPVWVETKVMRQYLSLLAQATPEERDVANLIAIRTREIATRAARENEALLTLCIRCFNSYLRSAMNARDARTAYYVMNEYRLLGESLISSGRAAVACEIAEHYQYYGLLSHRANLSFLLEVAAHDVVQLAKAAYGCAPAEEERMLDLLLELDQEIKEESNEPSLLGVRQAQIQFAAFLLEKGEESAARRICDDLRGEERGRLERVFEQLRHESSPGYREFTDRGVNFAWLEPALRAHLDAIERWSAEGARD